MKKKRYGISRTWPETQELLRLLAFHKHQKIVRVIHDLAQKEVNRLKINL